MRGRGSPRFVLAAVTGGFDASLVVAEMTQDPLSRRVTIARSREVLRPVALRSFGVILGRVNGGDGEV
jgi:hypothetical protein